MPACGRALRGRAPRYLPTPRRVDVRTARVNAILGTELTDDADPQLPRSRSASTPSRSRDGVHEVDDPDVPARRRARDRRHRGGRPPSRLREHRAHHSRRALSSDGSRRTSASGASCATSSSAPVARGVRAVASRTRRPRAGRPRRPCARAHQPAGAGGVGAAHVAAAGAAAVARVQRSRTNGPTSRLFEIGNVFPRPESTEQPLPDERERLAVGPRGRGGDAVRPRRACGTSIEGALRLDGVRLEAATGRGSTRRARPGCSWPTARTLGVRRRGRPRRARGALHRRARGVARGRSRAAAVHAPGGATEAAAGQPVPVERHRPGLRGRRGRARGRGGGHAARRGRRPLLDDAPSVRRVPRRRASPRAAAAWPTACASARSTARSPTPRSRRLAAAASTPSSPPTPATAPRLRAAEGHGRRGGRA